MGPSHPEPTAFLSRKHSGFCPAWGLPSVIPFVWNTSVTFQVSAQSPPSLPFREVAAPAPPGHLPCSPCLAVACALVGSRDGEPGQSPVRPGTAAAASRTRLARGRWHSGGDDRSWWELVPGGGETGGGHAHHPVWTQTFPPREPAEPGQSKLFYVLCFPLLKKSTLKEAHG